MQFLSKYSIKQFIKYFFLSSVAFLVDFWLLYVFTDFLHIYYLLSNLVSYNIWALVNFWFNKKYTFNNTYKNKSKQFLVFLGVSLINLAIASILLYVMVDYLHVYFLYAKVISTGIGFFINFFGHKYITFKYLQ